MNFAGIPQADWNAYSDPFITPSSAGFPANLETAFDLAEFLFFLHPEYAAATSRLVSHFCTDIEWEGEVGGRGERDELADILFGKLDLKGAWKRIGLNCGCFGTGLATFYRPFDRYLIDTRGPRTKFWELAMFRNMPNVRYNWNTMTYTVPDPLKMGSGGGSETSMVTLSIYDHESRDTSRLAIRHLDPRNCVLDEAMSGRCEVYDRIDPELRANIKNNQLHQINETPLAVLRCIAQDKVLLYDVGEVFILKEPTISGLSNRGWGVPPVFRNYRAIRQLSVYRKIDEVKGQEYALPFRVITPNFQQGADQTAVRLAMTQWNPQLQRMARTRRLNEQAIHTLPFPVAYQEFGADKDMSSKDHLTFQQAAMLDAMGYPAEIFKGSMAIQTLPTALRMLEANFHYLHHGLDMFSKWVTAKVQEFRQQDYIEPKLQPPRMADDIEQRHIWLQMAAGGEIPRRIAYTPFNISDPVEAAKERMREDIELQRAQLELAAEEEKRQTMGSGDALVTQMLQAQMGGMPAAGGMPMAPGMGAPMGGQTGGNVTPLTRQQDAQNDAMRLLNMDESSRRAEMRKMEAGNEQYYALVKDQMERARRRGASMGRQQAGSMPPG